MWFKWAVIPWKKAFVIWEYIIWAGIWCSSSSLWIWGSGKMKWQFHHNFLQPWSKYNQRRLFFILCHTHTQTGVRPVNICIYYLAMAIFWSFKGYFVARGPEKRQPMLPIICVVFFFFQRLMLCWRENFFPLFRFLGFWGFSKPLIFSDLT